MNLGYQTPGIKQRGFELFSNDQSSKRSDLRIRRFHAVRSRDRIFRRTGLMRRGPKPAPRLFCAMCTPARTPAPNRERSNGSGSKRERGTEAPCLLLSPPQPPSRSFLLNRFQPFSESAI
jgi:hypothetical protein